MTVVGSAYVELEALGNKFGSSLHSSVNAPLTSVGTTAESMAGRGRRAFGTMFGSLVANSNGALGPLADVADSITSVSDDLLKGKHTAGEWGLGIGAAATAAGALMTTLGDKEKIAFQQLSAAVTSSGHDWGLYEKRMTEAADSGAHFGYAANQTADALKQLTISTHSPDEAVKQLGVTMEIAATRHIPLESAARMVGRVYGGSTMILRQFGITANQLKPPVESLTTAQTKHSAAVRSVQTAQMALQKAEQGGTSTTTDSTTATLRLQQAEQNLSNIRQEIAGRTTHTTATALQLQSAQNRVRTATLSVSSAQAAYRKTQQEVADGTIHASDATLRLQEAQQRVKNAITSRSSAESALRTLQAGTTKTTMTSAEAQLKLKEAQNAVRLAQEGVNKANSGGVPDANAVRLAQEKLKAAQEGLTTANHNLNAAQKGSSAQAKVADHNLGLLANRLHGQAEAAANTFTGHLKSMGAHLENIASTIGQKVGPVLMTAGPILMALGAITETVAGIQGHYRNKALQAAAATTEEGAAAAEATAPTVTFEGALASLAAVLERLEPQLAALPGEAAATDAGFASMAGTADAAAAGLDVMAASSQAAAAGETEVAVAGTAMDVALAPILAIGVAIVALAAGVYLAYEKFKPFHDIVNAIGSFFKNVFLDSVHAVEAAFKGIPHFFETVWHDISGFLKKWGPIALLVLAPFIGIPLMIWKHFSQIKGFVVHAWNDVWSFLKKWGPDALVVLAPFIGIPLMIWKHFSQIKGFMVRVWHDIDNVWHAIEHDASVAWNWVYSHTIGMVSKIPGAAWHALTNGFKHAISWLWNAGKNIITGLINGIKNEATKLPGQVASIGKNLIEAPFKAVAGIFSPSRVYHKHGENIIKGLINGINAGRLPLSQTMRSVAGMVDSEFSAGGLDPFKQGGTQHGGDYGMQAGHHRVPKSTPKPEKIGPGQLITDIKQLEKLVSKMQDMLKNGGLGSSQQMPILFVAGDLVLRNKADIDQLSKDLYRSAQSISRAQG